MNKEQQKTWALLHHPSDNERRCQNCIHYQVSKTALKFSPNHPTKTCSIKAGFVCDIYHNSIPSLLEHKWEWDGKYE